MKRPITLIFFFFFIFSLGCQEIKYVADPYPLITMKPSQEPIEDFFYEMDADFYAFGFSPEVNVINITDIAMNNGAPNGLTNLRIREEQTFMNSLYLYISFGVYVPRNVKIYGVTVK